MCFLFLMPLSHGINVSEVWGCQVGARLVQKEPPGAIWRHFGVIWVSLWAFLVHFWALFFRVRFQGRFLELSGCCQGCRGAVGVLSCGPGASGSAAHSYPPGKSCGQLGGNSRRLAASFRLARRIYDACGDNPPRALKDVDDG